MGKDSLEYRSLDNVCFEMIEKDSALKELLERVRQDPDCRIEVRHNYLNCYYRCGSMFKLTFNTGRRTLTFTFDPKYLELKGQRNVPPGLDTWLEAKYKCPDKWSDKLGDLKLVMEAWFEENNKQEKTMQQKLAEQNSFAKGKSLHVIDIELAIPQHQELGRMDMIAVRREETGEGTRYIPVIVELKNGSKAFRGKSGILEHYKKTTDFLKNHSGDDFLRETIRRIWDSKRKLKLIDEPVPEKLEDAELMFAVTDWDGTSEDIRERYLAKIDELERPVWAAIFPRRENADSERENDYDLGKSGVLLPQHKKGN